MMERTSPVPQQLVLPVPQQLVFVVPVYNEEENLPQLMADFDARPWLFAGGSRIIVVDDGSEDATPELLTAYSSRLPLEVIRFDRNRGPGAAFSAGFAAALQQCDNEALIVTLEGDTTNDLDALPAMLGRAAAGADIVLADWTMVNVRRLRRLLSAAAGLVVRRTLGLQAKTVSSFFRVYRAAALRRGFAFYGDDFIRETGFACKAEILAKLAALGVRIEEVMVPLDWERRAGKSKMPILRTTLAYGRMLIRERAHASVSP